MYITSTFRYHINIIVFIVYCYFCLYVYLNRKYIICTLFRFFFREDAVFCPPLFMFPQCKEYLKKLLILSYYSPSGINFEMRMLRIFLITFSDRLDISSYPGMRFYHLIMGEISGIFVSSV